ncbi:MAG TPA: GPR1/FUN34/YaaH family transporter [Acidimicrobiales bacterium]|nr:GPR1/FUN34/YaaH family transporter [Acidimicrobiales bacterium]
MVLSPVAPPSVLGLFGFAGATFIVAANLAGWYGNSGTGIYLFPFAAMFGGIAQFLAGMWSYKARDALATAMHGMWGSFWLAYGVLWLLFATHTLPMPAGVYFPALGFWFIALAVITWFGAVAAVSESGGLLATLVALAAGSSLLAAAYISGTLWLERFGGWVLVGSAGAAIYTAAAMMLESTTGRTILPLLKAKKNALIPGGKLTEPIEFPRGMPGVKVGQ